MSEEAHTGEAPEIRDADEVMEEAVRSILANTGQPVIGPNGRPMQRIMVMVSDKIPTVQYGNVVITAGAERWIEDLGSETEGRQDRIDAQRYLLKDVEFVVGVERRLLQYAIDPSSKIVSPVTGAEAFAAPPEGYDKTRVVDPSVPPPAPETAPPAAEGVPTAPTPVPDVPQA